MRFLILRHSKMARQNPHKSSPPPKTKMALRNIGNSATFVKGSDTSIFDYFHSLGGIMTQAKPLTQQHHWTKMTFHSC